MSNGGVLHRRPYFQLLTMLLAGTFVGGAVPKPGPGSLGSVGPGNVQAFATAFDGTFAAALSPLTARLRGLTPVRGAQKREVSLVLGGKTGSVHVAGVGLVAPTPARFELTLTFGNFTAPSKGQALGLRGAVQFNFIMPRTGKTALAMGLFRGFLTLSGRFGGTAEVYGEVDEGKIVALVVTANKKVLHVGRTPRELVSYVSTVAGSGKAGAKDGTGGSAQFDTPQGVAVAPDGRVFVADRKNDAIRSISPTGKVTTLVRELGEPTDVGLDGAGSLIAIANNHDKPLVRIDTASGALTPLVGPIGNDLGGHIPLCQSSSCDGFTPMAGIHAPNGIDVHGGVIFFTQNDTPPELRMATGAGALYTLGDVRGACAGIGIGGPTDVAKGLNGDLYFVAPLDKCAAVMVMHSDGSFGVVAGKPSVSGKSDGTRSAARFNSPSSIAFDGVRYLYVSDTGNSLLRRVDVLTGDVLRVAGCIHCSNSFGLSGGKADAAQFSGAKGIALDAWGDVYVADERNQAIRLVRIATDPEGGPQIRRLEPYVLLRGSKTTITVTGENLGLTQSVGLGAGVTVKVASQTSKTLRLDVSVSATAPVGTHALSVKTFYGNAETPPGLSLQVLDQNAQQVTVTTIAGTGSWSPGVHDGPAIKQPFAFPAGMAALDSGRLVVADPVEQRLRFVGSKDGTERELVDLLLNSSGSAAALNAALAPLGALGQALSALGATSLVGKATSALLMPIVKAAVDNYCKSVSDPCTWIELPWAGTVAPGNSEGFRMSALMFLPVDVGATSDPAVVYAADTGNRRTRVIGLDPRKSTPAKSPGNMFSLAIGDLPFGVADAGNNAQYVSVPGRNAIWSVDLKNGGVKSASPIAGSDGRPGCDQGGGSKHPLGLPLGMDATKDDLFVADPFCATIWKIAKSGGGVKDIRGPLASLGAGGGSCSDGPVAFATFGAPVDVAVGKDGTIWVADAGCNSIREIKDVWADKEASAISGALKGMLGGLAGRLPKSTVDKIQGLIDSAQPDFIEANRWWVITVAGSREGAGGFRDGLAGQSLFSGPMGIAVAPGSGGVTYVFASDSGNRRVRLLTVPG